MGAELGQWREWNHDESLDWHLLEEPAHAGVRRFIQALNWHYGAEAALHERDFTPDGFRWIDCHDHENSVVSLVRYARQPDDALVTVFSFTPVPRTDYRIGVPAAGYYTELLNSDAATYGGTDVGNGGGVASQPLAAHGFDHSIALTVPPLGCLYLKRTDGVG
jgi:1,4-alpha-glucan branching enzyme